jgi:hypothetical protein
MSAPSQAAGVIKPGPIPVKFAARPSGLMAITDLGEFKFLAIEPFREILHRKVKASIGSNSPIPNWAAARVIEAWNVPTL